MNIEVRQGVSFSLSKRFPDSYGLVIESNDSYIDVLLVDCLYNSNGNVKFYCCDESDLEEYQYNVRLKDAPIPFSDVNLDINIGDFIDNHNVFVMIDKWKRLYRDDFTEKKVQLLDGGAKISDEDWDNVCNHLRITQPQKQLTYQRSLPDDVSEQSDKDDGLGIE